MTGDNRYLSTMLILDLSGLVRPGGFTSMAVWFMSRKKRLFKVKLLLNLNTLNLIVYLYY